MTTMAPNRLCIAAEQSKAVKAETLLIPDKMGCAQTGSAPVCLDTSDD